MSSKVLISIVGVIVAITILVIGIMIGKRISNEEANVPADNLQQKYFQAGWDAAKAKLEKISSEILIPASSTDDVIVGVIQKVDGNKLTVGISSPDPLGDPRPAELKTITVADSTKITVSEPQDREAIKKKMQESNLDPTSILPEYKEAKLSDLKVNQFVFVSAPLGSKSQSELTANEIKANYVDSVAIPEKPTTTPQE
ncbi:MAG TPA: hypothetical protein P5323_02775 [Candidatus Moranbacteria bacterium]|nr:hypothetical protein [Candidatus Moranbacteria bacterium]HRY28037.1 hypothetical protein [Candidatus Moranbacteria bacterium]HSA07888.1 hypothetical protein [Candidatus Moranbacteria bacterium]